MAHPMSRERTIQIICGLCHVTRENNTNLFVSSRMRLDRQNYSVFTSRPISHNTDIYKVVCDPSHVTEEPNVQKCSWPIPCQERERFKLFVAHPMSPGRENNRKLCVSRRMQLDRRNNVFLPPVPY